MLTYFRLHNFKPFQDSGQVPLEPLTCLVGSNSSGKSSLAHALQLFRQSNEERAASSIVPTLVLNGSTYEGGTYRDLVFEHRVSSQMGFEFGFTYDPATKRSPAPITPLITLPGRRHELMRYQGRYYVGGGLGAPQKPSAGRITYWFEPKEPLGPALAKLVVEVEGRGRLTITRASGDRRGGHWRVYLVGLPPKALDVRFPGGRLLPFVERRSRSYKSVGPRTKKLINEFAYIATVGFAQLAELLTSVRVLGPFRTPPERRYVFTGAPAADTGPAGKQAVDLLIMESVFARDDQHPLADRVSFWLKHLGLASGISARTLARKSNLYELVVARAGPVAQANFADVGFGISQVLPVLVQGLLAWPGSTYVIQQPELHLHPDSQAALADFFLDLAGRGVRCLVETHSEYFLLRLRRRLAESAKGLSAPGPSAIAKSITRADVAVLLTRKGRRGSRVTRLEIGKNFQFRDLPRDFMGQALDDRLRLLSALEE